VANRGRKEEKPSDGRDGMRTLRERRTKGKRDLPKHKPLQAAIEVSSRGTVRRQSTRNLD
jgi:hypothetical protein